MVRRFFEDTDLRPDQIDRIAYLVAHHHTFHDIDGADYQILVEADYIANASENANSIGNIENFMQKIMKTDGARRLTKAVFLL